MQKSKENVIFISAGMINPKKKGNPVAKEHAYLNYGLLGLASIVKSKGHNTILLHGKFQEPNVFLEKHAEDFKNISQYPLFLSLPSSFSLEWARRFVDLLKLQYEDISIVVGGRWTVMEDGRWVKHLFENKIDLVVYGLAENRIEKLLDKSQWHNIPYTDCHNELTQEVWQGIYPKYNYLLMPDYKEFQPSIDVSRGCGRGCSFCLEGKAKLEKLKEPIHVVEEIKELIKIYETNELTPYFEASHFNPSKEWAKEFTNLITREQISIKWRTETRVDSITKSILSDLAQSGLKILDIGLESASIDQLTRMKKTKNPNGYLEKASAFLKNCKEYNIWAKVNILLYPGENKETLSDTKQWLDIHKEFIKGISVNPLMV